MKRLRGVGVCSVAALAMSAVMAASASAAPEFSGPFPKDFTSKSGKVIIEEPSQVVKLVCTGSSAKGAVLGPKNGTVTVRLTGCVGHHEKSEYMCGTFGAREGEIVTSPLTTTLGAINAKEAGLALEEIPSGGANASFAEFRCYLSEKEYLPLIWTESVIGKLTPINKKVKPTKHFTLNFTQKKGKQKPRSMEGGPTDVLVGYVGYRESPEHSELGLSATDEITFTEPVEIKA